MSGNPGLNGARISLRRRDIHDSTIPLQSLNGIQGQSGFSRFEGHADASAAGSLRGTHVTDRASRTGAVHEQRTKEHRDRAVQRT